MADWRPHREPLRVTLTRTLSIAIIAGGVAALLSGSLRFWPVLAVLMLWPSFGGHWIDLLFLNWLRPRLPAARPLQIAARIVVWLAGGIVLALGARMTASLILARPLGSWSTWVLAGAAFIGVELIAHAVLHFRGRPNFYNGLG